MATTHMLPYSRFVAQVNTGTPEAKANYKALAQRNALALEDCPWREVSDEAVKPSLVEHEFTAVFDDEKYDAFCMTGSYDASANTEIAYAGMAAYRFALPQDYLSGSALLASASIMLTRDRFLLPGLRVAATLSDSTTPSTAWDVVRGDAEGCVKLLAQLANPANRVTAAEQATGAVTLDLAGLDASTKCAYLWVYLTVEDYTATWTWYSSTQHRLYAIEGSGMIVSQSSSITFSADVAADSDAPPREATTLKLVNLATRATDATLTLSGPVYSMVPLFLEHGSGGGTSGDHGCQYAVITGDFDEYSVSGMPGLVVYDFVNREIVSIAEESGHEIPATVKEAWRISGVMAHLASPVRIEFMCAYAPARCFAKAIIQFTRNTTTGVVTAYYEGSSSVNLRRTAEAADLSVMHRGDALFSFYQDRIDISSNGSGGEPRLPELQIPFSGKVSHVGVSISLCNHGSILICGDNSVGGDKSAVKLLMPNGNVLNFFVDLTPDNYADFAADEFVASGCGPGFLYGGFLTNDDATVFGVASGNAANPAGSDNYTTESSGYRLVTKIGKDDPELISLAQSFGCVLAGQISLLITGRFTKIGGLKANGAAILMYNAPSSTVDCQMSLVPLDVGPVRRGVVFVSDGSPLPLHVSHMLIEPAS